MEWIKVIDRSGLAGGKKSEIVAGSANKLSLDAENHIHTSGKPNTVRWKYWIIQNKFGLNIYIERQHRHGLHDSNE